MKAHVHPDKVAIVLVGDATVIMDKVKTELATDVALFDLKGNPLSLETLAVEPVSYDYQTAHIKDRKAVYALSVQTMELGDMNVSVQKKVEGGADVVEVSTSLAGMVNMNENMVFDAGTLSPVSFKSDFAAGPMTMMADLTFSGGSGQGRVKGPDDDAPKDVTISLIDGAILDGTVQYAIGLLPLAASQKYRFPVVDTKSGNLQNVDVEVVGEVPIEVPAGSFDTYKLKVVGTDGEYFVYCNKDMPHFLVKQEVPAQALNIELKELN
jgi:hypothetical protein